MPNEMERRRWNNEQMVANWPKRERFTDRVVPYVVAGLKPRPGERVLDIGAGGGKLSIAIGSLVLPGGKVTGADISAGMAKMATGRAEAAKAKNVTFTVADVQSESIPGGPFDAATSQFGVMFFEEPLTAFSNIRRQLKRGGRIAFACWQGAAKNTWHPGPSLARFAPPPRSASWQIATPARSRSAMRERHESFSPPRDSPRLHASRSGSWCSRDDSIADESQISARECPGRSMRKRSKRWSATSIDSGGRTASAASS